MTESESQSAVEGSENGQGASLTQLERDIIRQVEYYFGDSNLVRDKFLQEQVQKDEGWVELSVLLTFKRLASLSSDAQVIVDAVAKSDEGLIEISEDKNKIRRHPERPLPEQNEETRKEQAERTVYVKGFPLEGTTMEELLDFFKPYNKVLNVIIRKYHDKPTKTYKFKGSVFATFATKEQAAEFLEKEKVEYNGQELIRKWSNDYSKEKKEEYAERNNKRNKNKKEEKEERTFSLPVGALLKIESIAKQTTRETIKEVIGKLGAEISYVEFNTGDETAVVRLKEENAAKEVFPKIENGKLTLDDTEVTVSIVEGDEEKEFLAKAIENMKNRRQNQKFKGGRGNKGHGRFQHNNRKRAGSPQTADEPPAKV